MSFTLLSNSPVSGQIAWSNVHIVYDGVEYAVADGTTHKRFVYWLLSSPNVFLASDDMPALSADDTIVFLNKNGVAINVLNATALEGDLVVPGTVTSSAIATDAIDSSHIKSNAIVGRHILAGEITAEKLTVANLAAITANMGDITSGSVTIDQTGFIRGGASAYGTGTGFWMGYHGGKYKFRAGTPGSSGFEWNGDGFYVYGPDGSVTISSGVVDWGKISGAGKPANDATRNVFRGDWSSSSVAYSMGDIVLKDGNGWSCVVAHTSSGANQPPTSGAGNTWWAAYTVKGGEGKAGLNFSDAKILNTDPTFQSGPNGISVYNNAGNGTVTITREVKQADSPFGDSAYNLRISNTGAAEPYLGGFTFYTPTRANAQFVVRIIAKLPVGYELSWHSNPIGAGGESRWLSSSAGTGRFEEYLYFVRCGSEGPFHSTNYFALNGPALGTPGAPINWYLAYAAVYDFTALGLFVDVAAAAASANAANAALADIAADNKLTAVEKQSAANEWGIINRERASIQSQADALGILQERWDYDYVYAVLNDYITPLLQDISSTSVIDGATFRDKWSYFYEYRQRLINKMAAVAATKADWSNVTGSGKPENGATVGANSSNLAAGIGANLLPNSDLALSIGNWILGWNQSGVNDITVARDLAAPDWCPVGGHTIGITRSGAPTGVWDLLNNVNIPVIPGIRYEISGRLAAHRCTAAILIVFYSANGTPLTEMQTSYATWSGGKDLANYYPHLMFVTAPVGAAYAQLRVRSKAIGEGNPYTWFTQGMFCVAGAGQTEASPWSPANFSEQINSSNVTTYIANAAIGAAQIGSIELVGESAFKVRTNNSAGARMDMDSRRIKIFDANGTLRVQLGDLTV